MPSVFDPMNALPSESQALAKEGCGNTGFVAVALEGVLGHVPTGTPGVTVMQAKNATPGVTTAFFRELCCLA